MSSGQPSTQKVAILTTSSLQNDYKQSKTNWNELTKTKEKKIQVVLKE